MASRYGQQAAAAPQPPYGLIAKIAGGFVAFIFALMLFNDVQTTVDPGHIGVRVTLGSVDQSVLNPNFYWKFPFVQSIIRYDVRVHRDDSDAAAASKDLQDVAAKLAINYRPDPGRVFDLHNTVGVSYKQRVIDPAVQEAFKATTAQYTASELITKREEVKVKARELLRDRLATYHIELSDLNIVNFDFSKEFNAAIEASNVARQNVIKLQQELEQAKVNAQRQVVEADAAAQARISQAKGQAEAQVVQAKGSAEATVLQAEATARSNRLIAESLTPELLNLRKIELVDSKWSGQVPTTVIESGAGGNLGSLVIVPNLSK